MIAKTFCCTVNHRIVNREKRDEADATAFFKRTIGNNGFPDRVVIDKNGSNLAGLNNINMSLLWNG